MPLEVQNARIKPGATKTFEFADTITQRMVGISAFSLSFGNTDHHVQTASVSLYANHSGKSLSISPHAMMVDANGHDLDRESSYVDVVALAWVGVNNPNVKLGNVAGIANDQSSSPIAVPGTAPNPLEAALAGFSLSYGGTDHHMETASVSVGVTMLGNGASVNGMAFMDDDSGNANVSGTVIAGVLANCDATLRDFVHGIDSIQKENPLFSFGRAYKTVTALMNGFKVQYNEQSAHHVKTFEVKLTAKNTVDNQVVVTGEATLSDASGNKQSDKESYVSGFVVGSD
ncbi:hypothetical protein CR51_10685 [Caballeronia megalochromosomata]|nr:hypothetical protein CR51_10685 [Caballeronia megalochromosomata]